ncbi:MAG: cytochrome c [Thermodesulfobacteriota bacterium]
MLKKLIIFFFLVAAFSVTSVASAATVATKANYRFYCAQCHGVSGMGDGPNDRREMPVSPRDHTSNEEMSDLSDDDIISVIKEGGGATSKSTLMPPFAATLTGDEIEALKDYLRELCDC